MGLINDIRQKFSVIYNKDILINILIKIINIHAHIITHRVELLSTRLNET